MSSGAAARNLGADHLAARRAGVADARRTAHQDSADAAVLPGPLSDETSTPCVRNTFSLALSHRLAESARGGDPLSLILVRIDNYPDIRDRCGVRASNQFLDAAGKFFIASVRASDWVARFDMTTFAFLLPKTAQIDALCVVERLRTTAPSAGISIDGNLILLSLSFGTTEAVLGDSSEAIVGRAEEAMNASCPGGRKSNPLPRRWLR